MKIVEKRDLLFSIIIGEACALIFLLIRGWLELPEIFNKAIITFPVVLPLLSVLGILFVGLLGKKWPTIFQMGKNVLVGVLNSMIDLGILNFLMFVTGKAQGTIILLFKALSFTGGATNSYFWNKFWTFEHKEDVKTSEFVKFYTVALGGLFIHEVAIFTVVNIVGPQFGISPGLWANVGNMTAIFLGFFWDFVGYKFLVFKK